MQCSKCGEQNPDSNGFCGKCGAALTQTASVPQRPLGTVRTSGLATASLVLGIIGLFIGLLAILAIIFGAIALHQTGRDPNLKGRGKAIAGLVLGIIAFLLLPIVAFNIGGFLGQGTLQTAQTEESSVQTAILAGMANAGVGTVTAGTISPYDDTKTVYYPETIYHPSGSFQLGYYLKLPTHGTWTWDSTGTVVSGSYSGGGKTCTYAAGATPQWWTCT